MALNDEVHPAISYGILGSIGLGAIMVLGMPSSGDVGTQSASTKHVVREQSVPAQPQSGRASRSDLMEMTALIINANGYLCASVTDIRPLAVSNQYEVTCIEYRGGSGAVRYIMNAVKGTAFKAG